MGTNREGDSHAERRHPPPSACRYGCGARRARQCATAHAADAAVQLISHRYPGLEYYAEKLKSALPGVAVDTRLMQAPRCHPAAAPGTVVRLGAARHPVGQQHHACVVRQERLAGAAGRSLGEAQGRVQPGRLQSGIGRWLLVRWPHLRHAAHHQHDAVCLPVRFVRREGLEACHDLGRLHRQRQGAEQSAAALRRRTWR